MLPIHPNRSTTSRHLLYRQSRHERAKSHAN
jgi:hypothetical protein